MGLTSALADSSRNELRVIDCIDNFRKKEKLSKLYLYFYLYEYF